MTAATSFATAARRPAELGDAPGQGEAARVAFARPGTDAGRLVLAAVALWTAALYALTFVVVRAYYADHLPHYDSIGAYAFMFGVVNAARSNGVGAAAELAAGWSPSWLHGAYALLLAWLPGVRAPEVLVSLNFLLLLVAQASIVACVRGFGFGPLRQVAAALVPLVPGGMFPWDGGIQDLRRDPQLVLLATATLFLSIAYVRAPSWPKGVALGLVVGLAQWSRDNAAATVAIVAVPALALALGRHARRRDWIGLVRLGALPVAAFLLLAAPYVALTLPLTIRRYTTVVWGIGEDRLASLAAFADAPVAVLLGGDSRYGGTAGVAAVTAGLLLALALGVAVLVRFGVATVRPLRLGDGPGFALAASGLFVMAAVVLYNTLGLGYGARWHAMPFLPVAVGLSALLVGLLSTVESGPRRDRRRSVAVGALAAGAALVLGASAGRMLAAWPPAVGADEVAAVRAASLRLGDLAGRDPVALLWRSGFSRHHVAYYLAQDGRPPLHNFEQRTITVGRPLDLDQPPRPTDDPAALRALLDRSLRELADFVLVADDPSRYADEREILWPYRLGRPVVERLLADPQFAPVARFTLLGVPFVVLRNEHTRR